MDWAHHFECVIVDVGLSSKSDGLEVGDSKVEDCWLNELFFFRLGIGMCALCLCKGLALSRLGCEA